MNPYDLTPQEFMAYHYIKSREYLGQSYTRTSDLAEILKCTERSARRVVASLVEKGCIKRLVRSLYVCVPFGDIDDLKRDTSVLSAHSIASKLVETPPNTSDEVLVGAEPRPVQIEGISVKYYDDDSGLVAIGRVEPAETEKPSKSNIKYHRTVPRDQWTMHHVGKEFRLRLAQITRMDQDTWRSPVIGAASESTRLVQALYKWQHDYGITPQEAATLLDEFFESDDVRRISNEFPPYRLYMQYIKVNIDKLRAKTVSSSHLEEVGGQVLPW
jgi:hypothetical protein